MKKSFKDSVKTDSQRLETASVIQTSGKVKLVIVSDKERDVYHVPSYDYLLP